MMFTLLLLFHLQVAAVLMMTLMFLLMWFLLRMIFFFQLVTGHLDGSMSQWHELTERLRVAFRVSGSQEVFSEMGAPSTDMHWHAHPVRCMAVAPDG